MTAEPIRVVVVDDHPLSRMGIGMVLDAEPDITVAGEAGDGEAGLDLVERLRPDVVVMDVRMPQLDGIEATRRMVTGDPSCRVLVLTTFDLDEYGFAALRAGASGFLGKATEPAALVAAVRAVATGDTALGPRLTAALVARLPSPPTGARAACADGRSAAAVSAQPDSRLAALTPREVEVLGAIGRGLSNAEIAAELVVSTETVRTHVKHVLAKAGLRDRVQAVILAHECSLVFDGPARRAAES